MNTFFTKKKLPEAVMLLLFLLTPLLSATLFCLRDGRMPGDIYIPLGGWSDEITYYKQIEGILSHGIPRGYFGYNQSRALYGTLGTWGLVPLIPYVIWGVFFGWNYVSPIYANIFFCALALAAVYLLLRPKKRQMGVFALFWFCNQFLNRYVLSGVIEASVTAQLLIVTALGIRLCSNASPQTSKKRLLSDRAALLLCTFFICLLTLSRPYFGVLFLIPFYKALRDRRKAWVLLLPVTAVVVMVVFFLDHHFFCASYFKNVLAFEGIREAGLSGVFAKFFSSLVEIARLIWYAVRYRGVGVGWYYLLLALELLYMAAACIRRRMLGQAVPPMFPITLIGNFLILLSIIEMYDLGVGARHILSLIVANALLLAVQARLSLNVLLAAVCLLSLFRTGGADAPPYRDPEYARYMEELKNTFAEVVTVTDYISYENVVAMPTADRLARDPEQTVSTYYGLLYAMPAGVGISLDFEDFYDSPKELRAGYILVHPEGRIRQKLEEYGMYCVYENGELALYTR